MGRKWFIFIFLIATLFPLVSAADIAYVYNTQSSQSIINELEYLGLSYETVRNSEISSTDFSSYSVLLVTEDVTNKDNLPLNEKNAIFLHKAIAKEVWNLAGSGQTSKREIEVHDENSFVFEGVTIPVDDRIQIYGGAFGIYDIALAQSGIEIAAINPSNTRPVIAYSTSGGIKNLFFGIFESSYWSDNTKTMFKNSLNWILSDVDQDQDGWSFSEDCNDQDPDVYPSAPEKPYDGIDQDCDGFDLTDVDGDGFICDGSVDLNCPGIIGDDCDDSDSIINPDNPSPLLDCINDPPEILEITGNFQVIEEDTVVVEIIAQDPENDSLTYSINDPRFTKLLENTFIWETTLDDAGSYSFLVTVSDSDKSDSQTINIEITNLNQPPKLDRPIEEIIWEEDSNYTINLNDYFYDPDGETLTFGVEYTTEQTDITVYIEEDGTVLFTTKPNFFGSDWVVFYADDGKSKTLSNTVTLTVTPANDPVTFIQEIENFTWDEDTNLENAFNLYVHFIDPDPEELTFEVFGNENINVTIENGIVSFFPEKDFAGTEEIYFTATDGQSLAMSNPLTLTLNEMGEPPVFHDLTCNPNIKEDIPETCTLEASDFENKTLTFSVSNENNLKCDITNNVLTYVSAENYNGQASCVLTVTDNIHGSDSRTLEVNISPVNDAPEIISFTPEENIVSIIENFEKTFSVQAIDVDSDITISWILNGKTELTESSLDSEFIFSGAAGTYSLEARVSDSEFPVPEFWTIIVGPISDFTCEEVGGFLLSEKETCTGTILDVKDTNACCSIQGEPAFKDADACEILNNDITIEIKDPNSNEKFELGDTLKIELDIDNSYGEDQNIKVEAHLYNLDQDNSEEFVDANTGVKRDFLRTLKMDLEIPEDLDLDDEYALYIKAEDDICNQKYLILDLERPKEKVIISDFNLPTSATCGDTLTVGVKVENLGSDNQDVSITLKNREINIDESSETFELEKFDDNDDKETKEFTFTIPKDINSGTYEIEATAFYNSQKETLKKSIDLSCRGETLRGTSLTAEHLNGKLTLNQAQETQKSNPNSKLNYLPATLLFMLNTILVASALLLYAAYRKK